MQVITLDSVCSGQMNAEHNEHLVPYLESFDLGHNEHPFLFSVLEVAVFGV